MTATYSSAPGRGPVRKRKPSGVILQRMRGYWDDEVRGDGGKAKLHRQVRHAEKRAWQAEARADLASAR
jgi:hypothetical protein